MYSKKLEQNPLLETLSLSFFSSYWDRRSLAHVFSSPDIFSDDVEVCNNNKTECKSCEELYKKITLEYLHKIREVVLKARSYRGEFLQEQKRVNERLSNQNNLLEDLEKNYNESLSKIQLAAADTVLKLRCASPSVETYYDWRAKEYHVGSSRVEITDEDRGVHQIYNLNVGYKRKKKEIEEEYIQFSQKAIKMVDRFLKHITQEPALIDLARRELSSEQDYNIDEELRKWLPSYTPPVEKKE